MNKVSLLICFLALFPVSLLAQTHTSNPIIPPTLKAKFASGYGRLPMQFEPNMGQTDKRVRFTAKAGGGTLFLTDTEAVLTLPQHSSVKTNTSKRFDPKHIREIEKPEPTNTPRCV